MKAHNPSQHAEYPPDIPTARRYTHCGNASADARIRQDLARLAAGLGAELNDGMDALLLVGAYARGEGSVLMVDGEPAGYPGYRCLVLAAQPDAMPRSRLAPIEQSWSTRLETSIHLAVRSTASLPTTTATLWWLDIARGNVEVLAGDPGVLQRLRALDVSDVPPTASGWLLTDAAVGIALSRLNPDTRVLDRARQLHIAAVACGDAHVLASGRFGGTMRARLGQLQTVGPPRGLVRAYGEAMNFLGRPDEWTPPDGDFDTWEAEAIESIAAWHLGFESKRLGTPRSPADFARFRKNVYTTRAKQGLISRLRGAAHALLSPPPGFPYIVAAQEALPRAAVALAYGGEDAGNRLIAARLLGLERRAAHRDPDQLVGALSRMAPEVQRVEAGRMFPGTFYGPF